MKGHHLICWALMAGVLFMFWSTAVAQRAVEEKPNAETEKGKTIVSPPPVEQKQKPLPEGTQKVVTPVGIPVYQPPLRGAPGGRIGGGTRGIGDEVLSLSVLAPNHAGLTAQEQPRLYWFISSVTKHPIEVTVILEHAIYPLLEKTIALPVRPGLHSIRLTDLDVHLSEAVPYRWFVAVVPDPERRSKDILASGIIERIELPEALRVKLSQADRTEMPRLYAESGIWYDALMAISELIEATPNDANLRNRRAALLEQVGLSEVAQYEKMQGTPVK